jgi:hypothetical protein
VKRFAMKRPALFTSVSSGPESVHAFVHDTIGGIRFADVARDVDDARILTEPDGAWCRPWIRGQRLVLVSAKGELDELR